MSKDQNNNMSDFYENATFQVGSIESYKNRIRELEEEKQKLKQAIQEHRSNDKNLEACIHNITHELRTPLGANMGYTELALEDCEPGSEQEENIKKALSAGEKVLNLINSMLDFAKLESGKYEPNVEKFSLKKSIEDIKNIIEPQAKKNNVHFKVLDFKDVDMYTDSRLFEHIITNFASNAIKFAKNEKVSIEIESYHFKNRGFIKTIVRDTGIGMTKEEMQKIFTRFEQANKSTLKKFGGTGLGLSICKQFSSLLGGEIFVDSTIEKGSVFTLQIPIQCDVISLRKENFRRLIGIPFEGDMNDEGWGKECFNITELAFDKLCESSPMLSDNLKVAKKNINSFVTEQKSEACRDHLISSMESAKLFVIETIQKHHKSFESLLSEVDTNNILDKNKIKIISNSYQQNSKDLLNRMEDWKVIGVERVG